MTPDQINRLNGDRERPQVLELKRQLFDIFCALGRLREDTGRLCNIPGFSLPGATMVAATEYQLEAAIAAIGSAVKFLGSKNPPPQSLRVANSIGEVPNA